MHTMFISFAIVFSLSTALRAACDSTYYTIKIDTLGPDSFTVQRLSLVDDSILGIDTITKGQFINQLLHLYDSTAITLIGMIDTVIGSSYYSGDNPLITGSKDSIIVTTDTVLKGFAAPEFSTTELHITQYCIRNPDSSISCIVSDTIEGYSALTGKKFLMFADSLDNLRTTSISPGSWCMDNGNFIVNDSIVAEPLAWNYPTVKLAVQDFLQILAARPAGIRFMSLTASRTMKSTLTSGKMFDILGRSMRASPSNPTRMTSASGIYLVPSAKGLRKVLVGMK
jgi:hypothetical protein